MNTRRQNDAIFYIFIGIIFLLATIDIVFPIVMAMMKGVFWLIGGFMILGGAIQIKDSFKNKNT